jgi:hypothetical protein
MSKRIRTVFTKGATIVALAIGSLGLGIAPAQAADGQTASISVSPSSQTHPSGTGQTYTIAVSCQGDGGSPCGPGATVTIPLDTTTTPSMVDAAWTYAASGGKPGMITGTPTIVGNDLVITLNDAIFVSGFSGTISVTATPPTSTTPNGTAWAISPTVTGGNIDPVTVTTPAMSTANAAPVPVITKTTTNGGTVFEAGQNVEYTISAKCNLTVAGSLQFESGSLTDTIPSLMTYVSSSPAATVAGDTLTWDFATPASTPMGCAPGATGLNTYQVTLLAPSPAPAGPDQPLINQATFSGTGADATHPAGISVSTNAATPIQIVDDPSTGPGVGYASISKSALAPLGEQTSPGQTQYNSTYPGDWLPASASPSYTVGAAAASFQTTVSYGLVGSYQTDLIDPLPCLDNGSGDIYSSDPYTDGPCHRPAFHTTTIQVVSAGFDPPNNGLGAAVASGWAPEAILTTGPTVTLVPTGAVGASASSARYAIPLADIGLVATIVLPPDPALTNRSIQLTAWGYTDASLASLHGSVNQLHNVATAIPRLAGVALAATQDDADVFTVPADIQLGISKSFGSTGAATDGTTAVNIKGAVRFATPNIPDAVVLTDLLPSGMSWENSTASGQFTLSAGGDAGSATVTATSDYLTDYQSSGRNLIRITIPAADFTGPGSWTIAPPANYIDVTTPTVLGVYPNTDQIFLAGLGGRQIESNCSDPAQTSSGASAVLFETDNPFDLAGDGELNENFCENSASLRISGTGAAFALTKTVQGDLDTIPRGALGIGTASEGGSGVYGLSWVNVGSDTLDNAVIYDILPFVGDKGVSQGQSGVSRGSAFAPIFDHVDALPSGTTVQYSRSTNPCREEVYPNGSNTSCVNDWGVLPTDPSQVKALRFVSTSNYASGEGFAVSVSVNVPSGVINKIAWNSAATNAEDVTDSARITLPAEPPKVGIVAPTTPIVTTSTSDTDVPPHTAITDSVTVVGTGGNAGSLAWRLVGPIAPVGGSCASIDWTGAATVDSGTVAMAGDATVTTGPVVVDDAGCYSWGDALTPVTAGAFPTPTAIAPGTTNEVTRLSLRTPTITTKAASASGGASLIVHDVITLGNTGLGITPASPTQATLTWALHGPSASISGSCARVAWASSPITAQGSLTVTEDGDIQTPDTTIQRAGCYSYSESLAATADSVAVSTDPGVAAETMRIRANAAGVLGFTGIEVLWQLVASAVLVVLGTAVALMSRRRRIVVSRRH